MTKDNTQTIDRTPIDRLFNTEDTVAMLGGLAPVTLWRMVRDGKFPKPIKLNKGGNNLYRESWILDYIDSVDLNLNPDGIAKDFSVNNTASQTRKAGQFIKESAPGEVEEKPTTANRRVRRSNVKGK